MVAGEFVEIGGFHLQLVEIEEDVDQAQLFHVAVVMRASPAKDEDVAGGEGPGIGAGKVETAATRDDDQFKKLMGVQAERFLRIAAFDGDGEAIGVEPMFFLEGWDHGLEWNRMIDWHYRAIFRHNCQGHKKVDILIYMAKTEKIWMDWMPSLGWNRMG